MRIRLTAVLLCIIATPLVFAQAGKSEFFKTSDGVRIHYLESGNGRAIVFIPGWTMPAWIWQKQIDDFSKKYHVIAVDPRSQGESDKPPYGHMPETRARDYKELVDQLALKQPVFVGWSMACGELAKYAEHFGSDNVFIDASVQVPADTCRYRGRPHLQHDCHKGFLNRPRSHESPGALRLPARVATERRLPEIKAWRQTEAGAIRRRRPRPLRR